MSGREVMTSGIDFSGYNIPGIQPEYITDYEVPQVDVRLPVTPLGQINPVIPPWEVPDFAEKHTRISEIKRQREKQPHLDCLSSGDGGIIFIPSNVNTHLRA